MADSAKHVVGLNEIKANLKGAKAVLAKLVPPALGAAGLFLQRESQLKVPVDYGILKASAFTRNTGQGLNTITNIGYTANYAMYVHENLNGLDPGRFGRPRDPKNPGRGNFWDPAGQGQSKFLEQPARDTTVRDTMLKIFLNACQIKGGSGGITQG